MKFRRKKEYYYLKIAQEVSQRSTCLRRKYGAVIVNKDQILSTGYCGSPRKTINCTDIGSCLREQLKIAHGENYELCRAVHAEQNAIIHASRMEMIGGDIYLSCLDSETNKIVDDSEPCKICKRLIINSGIEKVIILRPKKTYITIDVKDWVNNNIEEIFWDGEKYRFNHKPGY